MRKRLMLCFLFAIAASDAAAGELTACQNVLIAHGIFFRGATVCNAQWLDRSGSYTMLERARACGATKHADAFMKRGFKDFDHKGASVGMVAACESVDRAITSVETGK